MSDDTRARARVLLEAAGMRPSEADLDRVSELLKSRGVRHAPNPATEPWSMPNTERWR